MNIDRPKNAIMQIDDRCFAGLAPSSNLQKAQADMIVDGCVDFRSKFRGPLLEKDETKKVSDL